MIYDRLKDRLLVLIKAPRKPPDPPAGTKGSIRIFRAAPNFLKYRVFVWGAGFAVAIFAEIAFLVAALFVAENGIVRKVIDAQQRGGWAAVAAVLLVLTLAGSVLKYFLIRLDYDMRYYVVTNRSLRIREGALIIHESTYTFANVQNLRIHQGPLERVLGLANLVVETAGGAGRSSDDGHGRGLFGSGHEGRLRGIANAREVRDQILRLLKQYRDTGLGDPEDREAPHAPAAAGLSPASLARLREVRDELRRVRMALEA